MIDMLLVKQQRSHRKLGIQISDEFPFCAQEQVGMIQRDQHQIKIKQQAGKIQHLVRYRRLRVA